MTLRELAEKEAGALLPSKERPDYVPNAIDIADAIERIARQFAERACREVWDEASNDGANMIHADDRGYSYKRIDRDETIADAIAAAERDGE